MIANKAYVDSKISNLVASAPTALDTLNELATALGNDANFSTTITTALGTKAGLGLNNTFSANNTFQGSDIFSGTNTFSGNIIVNSTTLTPAQVSNVQYVDIGSSLTTLLSNKQPTITNISTLTGYLAPVDLVNAQTVAGIKTFSSAPVMSGASITSATIPNSALASSYLTTANATSNYQPLLGNTVSTTVDLLTANRITEKIVGVSGSSPYTLNYSSGSVFYLSGTQPTTNFTVVLSNIPTSGTNNQFTFSLIYNSSTACFCNSVSATDTASSTIVASGVPKYSSGTAPTLTNSSVYIQSFTVISCFSTKYIITNVSTFN